MAKRFPVPEFEHAGLKDREWSAPSYLTAAKQAELIAARQAGDSSAYGAYAVQASEALYDKFKITGDHRHAVMCLLPDSNARLTGRSHAWAIQRVWILDSLEAGSCKVLHDWKTPRPMNTRLGPQDGVPVEISVVYALFGHMYADRWIGNRTICENDWSPASGGGFRVLSCHDEEINDFHHAVLQFEW
ncbi:MAG: hypothetical protein ACR2RB_21340 [Gammaproteobacteria bacterium]